MSRKTRKLIWSAPLVAAIAVAGALALFVTLGPSQTEAQAEEVPGVPLNLTATALSPTSIELSWDPPTDGGTPDGYRIDQSADGLVWYSLESSYGSTVYTDDDGLKAQQKRYYRVFAFNSSGHGRVLGPVDTVTLQSTVPDAVDDLETAEGADIPQEQIALTWTAPENPEGAPVTMYRIRSSKNGTSFSDLKMDKASEFCDGGTCTYTQKDLLEDTKLWYRVYATNSVGESKASNTDSASTAAGRIPTMPENIRAGLNPAGRMWLYWDEPVDGNDDTMADDPPGAPILGYYIWGGPVLANEAGGTTLNDANPFRRAATPGTPVTADPMRNQVYFVEATTDIALTGSILNRLDDFAGKPDLDGVEADDDATPPVAAVNPTHWGFRVMAVNKVVQRHAVDGTIAPDNDTDTSLLLADGNWSDLIRVNPGAEDLKFEPQSAQDIEDGVDRVAKNDDNLLSRPELSASRDTNVEGGRTSVVLKWETDDSTAAVGPIAATLYRLEYSEDRTDWTQIVPETAITGAGKKTYTHSDRTAGTTYYYRVFANHVNTAVGQNGTPVGNNIHTEASLTASVTTAQPDKPSEPDLTGVEALSETEIEITWDRPGADGSAAVGFGKIVGFRVDESDDGENWTVWMANTGLKDVCGDDGKADECSVTRKELHQGQTKYYRVFTINNASRTSLRLSDPSDADSATTLKSLASDDPGGLVVKSYGANAIKLLWNARADDITAAPITGYKIESSPLNDDGDCEEDWSVVVANTMSTTTSYTHMGLMPMTGQCYRIFGINVVATSSGFVGFGDDYITTYDNDAIATTDEAPPNAAPTAVGTIAAVSVTMGQMTAAMDVSSYFSDADMGDTLTYTAMSDMEMYATADIPADSSMLTITGVAAGTATIMVTATDMAGAMATQEIMVTVEAAEPEEVGPATGVRTGPFNEGGVIQVNWDAAPNATGYIIYAVNVDELDAADGQIVVAAENDGTAETFNLSGLNVGDTYDIYVVATGKEMVAWPAAAVQVTAN